ncbi:ABC transporter permease [Thermostilla marina]
MAERRRWKQNPIIGRELRRSLRSAAAFWAALIALGALGGLVVSAWPEVEYLDLTTPSGASALLIRVFFGGLFVVLAGLVPAESAGAFADEKEQRTFELLLTTPLTGRALFWGKCCSSMAYLAIMTLIALPIVMLCIPLGGASVSEVLATFCYTASALLVMGVTSVAISVFEESVVAARLKAAFVVAIIAVGYLAVYFALTRVAIPIRLVIEFAIAPLFSTFAALQVAGTAIRALQRPELTLVDTSPDETADDDVLQGGFVLQSRSMPDRLFVPSPKRELIPDGCDPVFDKEIRADLFAHHGAVFRAVVNLASLWTIGCMFVCLFVRPEWASLYIVNVMLFGMLLGAIFSADKIAGERERETLELLLTTTLSPGRIVAGKLFASLRIAGGMTAMFCVPIVLAMIFPPRVFGGDLTAVGWFLLFIALGVFTGGTVGLTCSLYAPNTRRALVVGLMVLFLGLVPIPTGYGVLKIYSPDLPWLPWLAHSMCTSPIAAVLSVPVRWIAEHTNSRGALLDLSYAHVAISLVVWSVINLSLLAWMHRAFARRWRVGFEQEKDI